MENLFYNMPINEKYDLKGSDRNRLVNPTVAGAERVLLDENLMQSMPDIIPFNINTTTPTQLFADSRKQPLYILGHSQSILMAALVRDTTFLERNVVMDYSLLAGLNSNDMILVVGIIGEFEHSNEHCSHCSRFATVQITFVRSRWTNGSNRM